MKLLQELLLLLKLDLVLLNNGGLRIVFNTFNKCQGLLLLKFIDHFEFLLRVSAPNFF